jgi:hypothetical protein
MNTVHHPTIHHNSISKLHHREVSRPMLAKDSGNEQRTSRQTYFWIWAMSKSTGAAIIYGCRTSREEAERVVNKISNASCEITELPTKDESDASRRLRALKLNRTQDIDKSLVKFQHKHL